MLLSTGDTFWVRDGACVHFSVLGPIWPRPVWALHAATVSVGSFVWVLLCLEGLVDLEFIALLYRENKNPRVLAF